jgi:aspartyl-tRNA(Asn)/glutamyl-tRNA(Gln) amidotransferase subunit A
MTPAMLNQLTISQLAAKLAGARFPRARPCRPASTRLQKRVDGKIHAFISYDAADALAQADAADQAARQAAATIAAAAGRAHRIKDVLAVKNQPLNCGSKILGKFISPYDATVVEKLKAAGAIVFGRLNMDEFAMGSSTENSAFGVTRNPWDTDAHSRRFLRRFGGGGRGGRMHRRAGLGHRRLHPPAGGAVRLRGIQTHLRARFPLRPGGLCQFAGSNRPFTKDVRDAATLLGVMSGTTRAIPPACRSRCRITPPR